MFAGDERSSSSSCYSGEFKRSHSVLEGENASIPEANENIAALNDEVLGTLLNSVLREKRQALLRSPQVIAFLTSQDQALLLSHSNQRHQTQQPSSTHSSSGSEPAQSAGLAQQNHSRSSPSTLQSSVTTRQVHRQPLNPPPTIRPPLSSNHIGNH